jgi:hypothetical protein
LFGSRAESGIHPVAGSALFDTSEADALEFKLLADQRVQFGTSEKNIAARSGRLRLGQIEFTAHGFEKFEREKGDLAFVVFLKIEVPVSPQTATGDAFDLIRLDNRMASGRATVMADEVVARGNKKMLDTNHAIDRGVLRRR